MIPTATESGTHGARAVAAHSITKTALHGLWIALGTTTMTLAAFMSLPVLDNLDKPPAFDTWLRPVTSMAPPPPAKDQEVQEVQEEETKPPELEQRLNQPLSLTEMEMALNPNGEGLGVFPNVMKRFAGEDLTHLQNPQEDDVVSMSELDQPPRAVFQATPMLTAKLRQATPAVVWVLFVVTQDGTVDQVTVQKSSNPAFDKAATRAVQRWRFTPGKRNGKPVRFRMRVPMRFMDMRN